MTTKKNTPHAVYDLDALIAQREEATGVKDGRVSFTFKGEVYTFRDPIFLNDDDLDDLNQVEMYGPDQCAWYMGDDEYDRFIAAGGSSNIWGIVFQKHLETIEGVDAAGNPSRSNRSQRRMAARRR